MFDSIRDWIQQAVQFLIDKIVWLLEQLQVIFDWVMEALFFVIFGIFYLLFDGILLSVEGIFATINFSSVILQFAAGHGLLPPQAAYFMGAIGFPQFVTMIAAAYLVRLGLNLIPSWATRA